MGSGCGQRTTSGLDAMATGTLSIANSKEARAILSADDLVPGQAVGGEVTVRNTGTATGRLGLHAAGIADRPGANGGHLSGVLSLLIEDVTDGSPDPVYSGALATMPERELASIRPREGRTYRFTVTFPDGGPPSSPLGGDNFYQGSSTTVSYVWRIRPASSACSSRLMGSLGSDRLLGAPGGDWVLARRGHDLLKGRAGADCLLGNGGRDILVGGRGRDRMRGGRDSDRLFAADGEADLVFCGRGRRDFARLDELDRLGGCEKVARVAAS
jgi:hypothetical protein